MTKYNDGKFIIMSEIPLDQNIEQRRNVQMSIKANGIFAEMFFNKTEEEYEEFSSNETAFNRFKQHFNSLYLLCRCTENYQFKADDFRGLYIQDFNSKSYYDEKIHATNSFLTNNKNEDDKIAYKYLVFPEMFNYFMKEISIGKLNNFMSKLSQKSRHILAEVLFLTPQFIRFLSNNLIVFFKSYTSSITATDEDIADIFIKNLSIHIKNCPDFIVQLIKTDDSVFTKVLLPLIQYKPKLLNLFPLNTRVIDDNLLFGVCECLQAKNDEIIEIFKSSKGAKLYIPEYITEKTRNSKIEQTLLNKSSNLRTLVKTLPLLPTLKCKDHHEADDPDIEKDYFEKFIRSLPQNQRLKYKLLFDEAKKNIENRAKIEVYEKNESFDDSAELYDEKRTVVMFSNKFLFVSTNINFLVIHKLLSTKGSKKSMSSQEPQNLLAKLQPWTVDKDSIEIAQHIYELMIESAEEIPKLAEFIKESETTDAILYKRHKMRAAYQKEEFLPENPEDEHLKKNLMLLLPLFDSQKIKSIIPGFLYIFETEMEPFLKKVLFMRQLTKLCYPAGDESDKFTIWISAVIPRIITPSMISTINYFNMQQKSQEHNDKLEKCFMYLSYHKVHMIVRPQRYVDDLSGALKL